MIALEDFLAFVDDALEAMVAMVGEMGDDLANLRPDASGTNTPYVILNHCLGVMEFWGGHLIAGRPSERDREAEFASAGQVEGLIARARRAQGQLRQDLGRFDVLAPPRMPPPPRVADSAAGRTQGGALLQIYQELAQHRGHMELTRDVIGSGWASLVGQPGAPGVGSPGSDGTS